MYPTQSCLSFHGSGDMVDSLYTLSASHRHLLTWVYHMFFLRKGIFYWHWSFKSHKAISEGWLPSSSIVDFIGTSIFLAPFIINIPIAVVAGVLALNPENENTVMILISVHYCIWGGHCIALTATVMLAGIRLIHILNQHLEKINPSGSRYGAIKNGIFKVSLLTLQFTYDLIDV